MEIFRRVDSHIYISPMYCALYNITGICALANEKVQIRFKNLNFYIYVSIFLSIKNLEFDGLDYISFNRSMNCLQNKESCCNLDQLNKFGNYTPNLKN